MTLWVKFDFESTLTFESILTLGQSRLSMSNYSRSISDCVKDNKFNFYIYFVSDSITLDLL
jgi:hypothetical protein